MAESVADTPLLLIKKMAGVGLLILGVLATALGYRNESNGLLAVGVVLLLAGLALIVLKILRRNQL